MEHMTQIPLYAMIPFALMLGSIAALPIFAHEFWESNRNKLIISLVLGIPMTIWLLMNGFVHQYEHAMIFDYVPFIILLGSLFVITGGIYIDGNLEAKPKVNSIFMAVGAVLASLMGTTGAAMLLIRPLISTNKERHNKVHIILFFIGIVANCGGLLTPLGDPPLFMMYLRGAPFDWFFNLLPEWIFVNSLLIVIFFLVDTHFYKKETKDDIKEDHDHVTKISIHGKLNFLWLVGVVLAVAFINPNTMSFIKSGHPSSFLREAVLLLMTIFSLKFTRRKTRVANHFSWEPILEVAYLFLGIFITMVPCLVYLEANANQLGVDSPILFYYATGGLSAFLDNTPTAVTFYSLATGLVSDGTLASYSAMPTVAGIPEVFMIAISTAAVYFGAMTYIGNGPNFMVKAIAESQGIKMPDFFSYMFKFSLIVLLPLFILTQLIFLN